MTKIYKLIFAALLCTNTLFAGVQNLILKELTAAELPANTLFKFPNAVKTKYVQLDLALLDEQNVFSINLFEGNQIDFRYDRMYSYTNGAYSWVGKSISGSGDIIISTFQSNISGIFRDNAGTKYMLQQINQSDIYAITEVNIEAMNEAPDGVKDYVVSSGIDKKTRVNADVCAAGNACAGSVTIDLMVLGAAAAITNAGSVPAFIADVTSAVTEMNTAYTNSGGTNLTFNLAHCNSTAFATTADMSNDLTNFAADAGVQALRNTYYADLVGLWAGSGNYAGFCGLGYLNINATNYSNTAAFTVTDYGCGMTNLSFAHECGHNMGLRHDWFVDGGTTPCSHHHGYTNAVVIPGGVPIAGRWRTIMAYNNECSSNGFNCTRLARWSNPGTNYLGDPTGIAIGSPEPANEIYGFERFKCVVSQFRIAPIPTPVTLISFKGTNVEESIKLDWETTNEVNLSGYEIEMKNSVNKDFASAGFIKAANTKEKNNYGYTLNHLQSGVYFVRLKMIDIDNSYTYSEVIKATVSGNAFQTNIYPNPAQSQLTISMYNPSNQNLKISLCDMLGRELMQIMNENSEAGQKLIPVDISALPKGMYVCRIQGSKDKLQTKVIIE